MHLILESISKKFDHKVILEDASFTFLQIFKRHHLLDCLSNTQIHITSALYVLSVSLALLLYVGIGYLVLLKHAPKTFVFKK